MALFRDPSLEFINEVRPRPVEAGLQEAIFNEKALMVRNATKKFFAKLLGPFRQADDRVKCESLLNIGIKHRHFDSIAGCTLSQLLAFLKFLRTPAGQDAITQQARYVKLQRKGADEFSAEEVALLSLAQVQQDDLAKATGEFSRKIEDQIQDHNMIIEDLQLQLLDGVEEIKRSYLPVGVMPDLEADLLLFFDKCCSRMELAAQKQGIPALPSSQESLDVMEVFGESVRKRNLIDFLNEGDSKDQLMKYTENKRQKLDRDGDVRPAKRLRSLLLVVGGEQAIKAPGLVQDPASRADVGAQDSKAALP